MSAHHSDNKNVLINHVPLFASSWLALFSVLRENFNASRAVPDLDDGLVLRKGKSTEQATSDLDASD